MCSVSTLVCAFFHAMYGVLTYQKQRLLMRTKSEPLRWRSGEESTFLLAGCWLRCCEKQHKSIHRW